MVKKVYLFGDSISYGQLISSHQTWATALAQSLASLEFHDITFLTQNAGVNGNTTRQALERIRYDVTSHNPDFVVVQFGMNDCNYWETDFVHPRVSQSAFMANTEEIVTKIISSGAKHCFIGTNHPSKKGAFKHLSFITYDESNALYNKLVRKIFEALRNLNYPVTLIDNEQYWVSFLAENKNINLSDLLLEDGIHLSEKGHRLYNNYAVNIIVDKIKSILDK